MLAALGLVTLIPAISQTILIPALPRLGDDLGAGPDQVAWTITAYLITASVGTPVLGRLGDMFGRRRMQLWALALYAAGSVLCLLAESLPVLAAGRLLQGCVGGVFALAIGIVRETYPPDRVGRNIGALSALVGIGTSAGFVCGGLLVDSVGVGAVFWLGLGASAVAGACLLAAVPESHDGVGGRVDVRGAVLLAVAVTLPLIAFSESGAWGRTSLPTLGLLGAGLLVALAWLSVERRTPEPLVDMATLARPTVRLTNLATFLVGCAMFGLFVLTPQLAQADRATGYGFGLGAAGAGLLLLPGGLLMLVLGPVSGMLGRRAGDKVPLALGGGVAAAGLLGLGVAHGSVAAIVLFAMVASAGIGFAFPAMPNLVVADVRPAQVGEAAGFNALLRGVGSSVGTQLSAAILAASAVAGAAAPTDGGYVAAYGLAAGAAAGAALIALAIPRARGAARVLAPVPSLEGAPPSAEAGALLDDRRP